MLTEGTVELVLRDDPCDPTSSPAYFNVTADFTNPQCTLSLLHRPTLSDATFTILAEFSEPVLPVAPVDIAAEHAVVLRVVRQAAARLAITLRGVAGATAAVQLSSFAFADLAGNPGLPSNRLEVEVPCGSRSVGTGNK